MVRCGVLPKFRGKGQEKAKETERKASNKDVQENTKPQKNKNKKSFQKYSMIDSLKETRNP